MDWIKIYAIVLITISFIGPVLKNGEIKKGAAARYDWYDGIIGTTVSLPIWARIFGYW